MSQLTLDPAPDLAGPARPWPGAGLVGGVVLATIVLACFLSLPWSLQYFDEQRMAEGLAHLPPQLSEPMGTDRLGRSMLWRCLLGGTISLAIGVSAAVMSVIIGVAWGGIAGYLGGRTDAFMMRVVDILYGLPYVLLVVMVNLALRPVMHTALSYLFAADSAGALADVLTLLIAIGGVSWLTMARVIRGQVLSLRDQQFIEAARACGFGTTRIMVRHMLPNLVGPLVVYATLTVPTAILQESFLSFLGIGVQAPLPSWGNLAAEAMDEVRKIGLGFGTVRWWLPLWPCLLLGVTLMSLNFMGDALRRKFDPRSRAVER